MNDHTPAADADEPMPAWCHPTRAKDMLGMTGILVRDALEHDHHELYATWGIRPDEAVQSLRYAELAELRVWGIDEMAEAPIRGQSSSEDALRRRINMAMKAEGCPDYLHPADAVLLMERSGLMLSSELRDAVVCMSTRTYGEDLSEFSLEDENRLRRLLGKPPLTETESDEQLANETQAILHTPIWPSGAAGTELNQCTTLAEFVGARIDGRYADLPAAVRKYVDAAFYPCPEYWDSYTRTQRERKLEEYDVQNNPNRQVEFAAAWWDVTMDASAWWSAESISPSNAAMLLSRRNPNSESLETAETNSNDEMGPDDFRRLKNMFEGALDTRKTFQAWIAYARERGLKIHSWISEWEAWITEVVAKKLPPLSRCTNALPENQINETFEKAGSIEAKGGTNRTHLIKTRTRFLDAEIERAKSTAGTIDHHAIWTVLKEMALQGVSPFTGNIDKKKGIEYSKDTSVAHFSKDALRKRLNPSAR